MYSMLEQLTQELIDILNENDRLKAENAELKRMNAMYAEGVQDNIKSFNSFLGDALKSLVNVDKE